MFAVVARGVAVGPRAAGARIVPLRMIHALLFLAASIVSPGACGAACCSDAAGWKGPPTCCAAAGHPTPEPAAADGCCGKACCTAAAPRSAPAETVAPVNGQPGADCGCHCESAPRGVPAPPVPRDPGPPPAALLEVAGPPDAATVCQRAVSAVAPAAFFVERPVRIRFGVWLD